MALDRDQFGKQLARPLALGDDRDRNAGVDHARIERRGVEATLAGGNRRVGRPHAPRQGHGFSVVMCTMMLGDFRTSSARPAAFSALAARMTAARRSRSSWSM